MAKKLVVTTEPVVRVFDAPREKVWKAWTDPAYIKQWWGPKDFTSLDVSIDLCGGQICL